MKFTYRGRDASEKPKEGEVEAASLVEAVDQLRSSGVSGVELQRSEPEAEPGMETVDAFTFLNRSLAEMTRLGFALPRALEEIGRGMRRGRFRSAIGRIEERVREGRDLGEAVGEESSVFPAGYRSMVAAGVKSGDLPGVFSAVARHSESLQRVRRAVAGALAYPALVLFFGLLFLGFFLAIAGPLYKDLIIQMKVEPGFFSRLLMEATEIPWGLPVVVVGMAALVACACAWMRRTVAGERLLFRIPRLGRILRMLCMAKLFACLESLLRGKTPLEEAIPLALGASGSLQLERASERLAGIAAEGASLSSALREAPEVSDEIVSYVDYCERAGRGPAGARELAGLMTSRAEAESDILFLLLFPAALVVVGTLVLASIGWLLSPYVDFMLQRGG